MEKNKKEIEEMETIEKPKDEQKIKDEVKDIVSIEFKNNYNITI